MHRAYLLVGIATYAAPSRNLRSPVNDVLDTLRMLLRLGMDLSHCAVVTSPALDRERVVAFYAAGANDPDAAEAYAEAALAQVRFHGGTVDALADAAAHLRAGMARAAGAPHLMVTWSGHSVSMWDQLIFALHDADADYLDPAKDVDDVVDEIEDHGLMPFPSLMAGLGVWPKGMEVDDDEGRADHSIFAVLNGCRSGAVRHVLNEFSLGAMVMTAGSGDRDVREYLLGGSWRGLLSWSVNRVLEQHGFVADGEGEGIDLSYGGLLQSTQALALAMQGVRGTASLPEMHGLLPRDPYALNRRVCQDLDKPPGTSQYGRTRVGSDLQLWGDVDGIIQYSVWVDDGDGEERWSRVVFHRGKTAHTYEGSSGEKHLLQPEVEYWYHKGPLKRMPRTVRFEVDVRLQLSNTQAHRGHAKLDAAFAMRHHFEAPLVPPWSRRAPGVLPDGFLDSGTGGYAIRIAEDRIEWLRGSEGVSPFTDGTVGMSVHFDKKLTQLTTARQHCQASL
jgi:hypothetical protein